MNCARVIFVLLALFQYGWAATSPEATSLASAIRCYGLLHVEAKRLGVVKPDGSLNWDAACTATQVKCSKQVSPFHLSVLPKGRVENRGRGGGRDEVCLWDFGAGRLCLIFLSTTRRLK